MIYTSSEVALKSEVREVDGTNLMAIVSIFESFKFFRGMYAYRCHQLGVVPVSRVEFARESSL